MSSGFNNGSCNKKNTGLSLGKAASSGDSKLTLNNSVELSAKKVPSQMCVGSPGIDLMPPCYSLHSIS